jgi:hypothetical protein
MLKLQPTDRGMLASAVADSLVVSADQGAPDACLVYYFHARSSLDALAGAVRASPDAEIRALGTSLLRTPDDPESYHGFRQALLTREAHDPAVSELIDTAWRAEHLNRLGYFLGSRYTNQPRERITADHVSDMKPVQAPSAADDAEILVTIPFQDRNPEKRRLRNLLACLLTLNDQSYPRDRYRVVVVESDDESRHRDVIEPLVDRYYFANRPGILNKAWTINVGVVEGKGKAEAVCILDADVLADREFIERNAERFRRPGTAGHLPYRNMRCLSEKATTDAIGQRLVDGAARPDPETLRGFVMRRPPGCCVWARTDAFLRVGGMDERFVGWGGDDNDFAYRMDMHTPFDHYDDELLHMWHPPSAEIDKNGDLPHSKWIPWLSWKPTEPIGRIDKFTTEEKAQ